MKIMKVEVIPAVPEKTEAVVDKVTCELCGAECSQEEYAMNIDWVNIVHKKGNNYPEGGWYEATVIDLCPKCFHGKLIPWLHRWNGQERVEKFDY